MSNNGSRRIVVRMPADESRDSMGGQGRDDLREVLKRKPQGRPDRLQHQHHYQHTQRGGGRLPATQRLDSGGRDPRQGDLSHGQGERAGTQRGEGYQSHFSHSSQQHFRRRPDGHGNPAPTPGKLQGRVKSLETEIEILQAQREADRQEYAKITASLEETNSALAKENLAMQSHSVERETTLLQEIDFLKQKLIEAEKKGSRMEPSPEEMEKELRSLNDTIWRLCAALRSEREKRVQAEDDFAAVKEDFKRATSAIRSLEAMEMQLQDALEDEKIRADRAEHDLEDALARSYATYYRESAAVGPRREGSQGFQRRAPVDEREERMRDRVRPGDAVRSVDWSRSRERSWGRDRAGAMGTMDRDRGGRGRGRGQRGRSPARRWQAGSRQGRNIPYRDRQYDSTRQQQTTSGGVSYRVTEVTEESPSVPSERDAGRHSDQGRAETSEQQYWHEDRGEGEEDRHEEEEAAMELTGENGSVPLPDVTEEEDDGKEESWRRVRGRGAREEEHASDEEGGSNGIRTIGRHTEGVENERDNAVESTGKWVGWQGVDKEEIDGEPLNL